MKYEPQFYTIQHLVCTRKNCDWISDFVQIFRDCGSGDGDMIDGPEWHNKGCPKCGEKKLAGQVHSFWADENEGALFVWDEQRL